MKRKAINPQGMYKTVHLGFSHAVEQNSGRTLLSAFDPRPNLTLRSATVAKSKGGYADKAVVANTGGAATPATAVQVVDNGKVVGTATVGALAPGGQVTVTVSWKTTGTGSHTVQTTVDPANTVSESDETDNKLSTVVR